MRCAGEDGGARRKVRDGGREIKEDRWHALIFP